MKKLKNKIIATMLICGIIGSKIIANNKNEIIKYSVATILGLGTLGISIHLLFNKKQESNKNKISDVKLEPSDKFVNNQNKNVQNIQNFQQSDKFVNNQNKNIQNIQSLQQSDKFEIKKNWDNIDVGVKIDVENPMKHISDDVKIGDITQIMSHDALCLDKLMLGKIENSKISAKLSNIFGVRNLTSACQYNCDNVLVEQAKCGATVFDIRLAKPEKNNSNFNELKWVPHHNGVAAKVDALKEIISLVNYANEHLENLYILKLRVGQNNSNQLQGFFNDLNEQSKKIFDKELQNILFNSEKDKKITELTLGEIRNAKKNVVILLDEYSCEIPEEISKIAFTKQSSSAFNHFSQSINYNNEALAKTVAKNIIKKQEEYKKSNVFIYSTPAHTFGLLFAGITNYVSPLKDASKNNNDVTSKVLDQLYFYKCKLQAYGLNGIRKGEKCITDIIKYSNVCIFNTYGKDGFKKE